MTMATISQQLSKLSNDYTKLEKKYFDVTGSGLSLDITSTPPEIQVEHPLNVSVIVPGWNAKDSILACLTAIEQSSFNLKHPEQLQVIFIDDNSTDNTWGIVSNSNLSFNLIALRINHAGQTQAMNTGLSVANGDIIISCDADMILNYYTIEHFVIRHQILPNTLLVGFRSDTGKDDPQINSGFIHQQGIFHESHIKTDERITFPIPGWPSSMCLASEHFKKLSHGYGLLMPEDPVNDPWILPDMVFGALFSLRKKTFFKIGGYDERFKGWGCADTYLAAKAIAAENLQVVPIYAASGLHISHPFRTENKQLEYSINRKLFKELIETECTEEFLDFITPARTRIKDMFTHSAKKVVVTVSKNPSDKKDNTKNNVANLLLIGEYAKALEFLSNDKSQMKRSEYFLQRGDALLGLNQFQEAIDAFQQASELSDKPTESVIRMAIAQAANEQFSLAHHTLKKLSYDYPNTPGLSYWYRTPAKTHIEQGKKYYNQGFYNVAIRCFEAALIINPNNNEALKYRNLSKLRKND